jgi:hypothetical protein
MVLKPVPKELSGLIATSASGSHKLTSGHTLATAMRCKRKTVVGHCFRSYHDRHRTHAGITKPLHQITNPIPTADLTENPIHITGQTLTPILSRLVICILSHLGNSLKEKLFTSRTGIASPALVSNNSTIPRTVTASRLTREFCHDSLLLTKGKFLHQQS